MKNKQTTSQPNDQDLDPRLCRMALADPSTGRQLEKADDAETDRLLDAYREGQLSPEERQSLEAQLRREPRLRRRLAERANITPALPAGIRQQVLETVEPKRSKAAQSKGKSARWLAAAVLLLGVATALLLPTRGLPPEVTFQVEVRGIAATRDHGATEGPAEATASTVVRIVARPEQALSTPVAFAVYREEAGRLERIEAPALDLQRHGDAATLAAPAGDLITGGTGLHILFLVVARPGDLPGSITVNPGEDPRALLSGEGQRRAYPFSIRWLSELPEDRSTSEGTAP